jgi:ABC-type transporter Mla subunit MlaD
MRRLLVIACVAAACVGAFVLTGASSEDSDTREYKVLFDNAFGLVEGGDFRVGGVKAGQTTKFEVRTRRGQRPLAEVTVKVQEPGFGDFREDATCTIKPQSLIGEYYVDCQGGNSPNKLPTDGDGTVPVKQTTSTVPQDLVNNVMRRPIRERFRLILSSLGAGLAGRPDDLQAVLRRAHPGLRETSRVLRILGNQNRTIERFIADSDTIVEELEANKRDVVRWVRETGRTAEISATRRADIQRSFERLPTFLSELRPTMARLGELADIQTPLLADLERAAPSLETFFTRLGPFSEASRPALRSLGSAARVGTRAFRRGKDEVAELNRLAPETGPTAKPLRQFLQTFDDRRRAVENDPRAKQGAPPSPDKTAIPGAGGFTGMEAFWNYFWWQTWSLNGFDKFGHILRVSVYLDPECEEYVNSKEHFHEHCDQWLGPDQPGFTTRDFTDGSAPSSNARRQAERPAASIGERRGPGQPDAGPLPGQRDISRPQIVLPPGVRGLLDVLRPGGRRQGAPSRPEGPNQGGASPDQDGAQSRNDANLLDYLMTP